MADVLKKVPVREQNPKVRATNFEEVCLGYNQEEAMEEATRCINCKNAKCIQGCPVSINIPAFIKEVKEGNIEEAYKVIGKSSALPAVCGRVCPQESQCEGQCIRGIKGEPVSIGKLERFVADYALENDIKPEREKDKERERQSKTENEWEKDREQPPVPSNGVSQAAPVAVKGLSLEISSGKREEENKEERRNGGIDQKGEARYNGTQYERNQLEEPKHNGTQYERNQQEEAPNESIASGGFSESLLRLNMDAIGIRNEQTVKGILALARRRKLGGPCGTLWKVLSSEYRSTLLKKNEPGDYILWALNHPAEFEDTYTGILKKRVRGR